MNTTKKIFAGLACAFLPIVLLAFGVWASVYQTLGNAAPIKSALHQSGVYSAAIEQGLNQIGEGTINGNTLPVSNIPVNQPEVRSIIQRSFPPEFLERQANGALEDFYKWLQGGTQALQLRIDLAGAKIKLADGLAGYAAQRLQTLPVCTAAQDIMTDPDPFNASCVPPRFDKAAAAQKVRDDIANSKEFLEDPVITPQDLHINNTDAVQIGDTRISRSIYGQVKNTVLVLGILAGVFAAAILFLSVSLRSGARRLGIIALSVGSASLFIAGIASLVIHGIAGHFARTSTVDILQKSIADVVRLLAQDIRNWWLWYGIALVMLGGATLVILAFTRQRATPELPTPQPQNPKTT